MSRDAFDALKDAYRGSCLGSNFRLEFIEWKPEGSFAGIAGADDTLRAALCAKAESGGWPAETIKAMRGAYMERYASGLVASYAMALELFQIEEDNWFSFEKARSASAWFAEPAKMAERRELILLKGVAARPLMKGLIVPPDLIAAADFGAEKLAFIMVGLAD